MFDYDFELNIEELENLFNTYNCYELEIIRDLLNYLFMPNKEIISDICNITYEKKLYEITTKEYMNNKKYDIKNIINRNSSLTLNQLKIIGYIMECISDSLNGNSEFEQESLISYKLATSFYDEVNKRKVLKIKKEA